MWSPSERNRRIGSGLFLWLAVACVTSSGCQSFTKGTSLEPISPPLPDTSHFAAESSKVSLPPYRIGPTDILNIQATKVVPRPPHTIETYDVLRVSIQEGLDGALAGGDLPVDAEGRIDLGPTYGKISVVDLSMEEARNRINEHIQQILAGASASVTLLQASGTQQVAGQHMVGPDGTVNLQKYGTVRLAGLTTDEAAEKIEAQLSNYLLDPEVSVDVFSHNSSHYFIITQGAGQGDNVVRAPVTGNETVLDAISQIRGLSQLSSQRIWISRPAPSGSEGEGTQQILPVDWTAITRRGDPTTNFQIMPGDRVFIAEDRYVATTAFINKATQPFQRLMGFVGLGTQTLNSIKRYGLLQ